MRLAFSFLITVLIAGPAIAQSTPPPPMPPASDGSRNLLGTVFSAVEQQVIEQYFGGTTPPTAKPGDAKNRKTPPGQQIRLEKYRPLPPGVTTRDLPADLKHRLPPVRRGAARIVAGNDVVLVDAATGIVLDILPNVAARASR